MSLGENMDSQIELETETSRFVALMPLGQDQVLTVLKGHLLIEELLTELLKIKLEKYDNPLGIKVGSNTMFAQKLNLYWAIAQKDIEFDVWVALKELNSIRNKMAHTIEPQGIDEKIELFNKSISAHKTYMMPEGKLEFSICYLYIILNQLLEREKNS
ncbi:hypothetical protein CRN46_15635 [Vibrio vulnificus]|nr:hypothetical protein XM74_c11498 [Vibrio vulnificus]POC20897.1 hypothetical protein CRN46_15635 [Vibrio vulnificus]